MPRSCHAPLHGKHPPCTLLLRCQFLLLLAPGTSASDTPPWELRTQSDEHDRAGSPGYRPLSVRISAEGRITGIRLAGDETWRPFRAETALAGCRDAGPPQVAPLGAGLEIERHLIAESGSGEPRRARLTERFLPRPESIRWELEIRGEGEGWTTPVETRMHWPLSEGDSFWTAWGDPRPDGSDWTNPLRPAEWHDREFHYGGRFRKYFKEPGTFSLPVATIIAGGRDVGVSLVLSPEDVGHALRLRTTAQGDVAFIRENHRLGAGDVVRCSLDVTAHPADWCGGVAWLAARHPELFEPPNPAVHSLAGCASYSRAISLSDAERLLRMSFRVNWQSSFDFPYMGMFIPPVASSTDEWIDFRQQPNSIERMRAISASTRQAGFHTLNYFNVTEFGAQVEYPAPEPRTTSRAERWQDANDFLYGVLHEAILPGADGRPIFSWEKCVVMDPGEPCYRDFLIEQARRHVELLPLSAGICIDRLDWLLELNREKDDGVTWCGGRASRSLTVSWRGLMERLGPVFHDAGKVVFVNPMDARIDLMRHVDGFYDEHGQHPHSINSCALLALFKPYCAWTWELEEFDRDPDAYFQRHLHLGAYLTAPVAGNDHTIQPDPRRDRQYQDYGPLLDALRGRRWVLLPHAIRAEDASTLVNLFEVPGGYVAPVTFGGEEAAVEIRCASSPGSPGDFRIEVIHPGSPDPVALRAAVEGDELRVQVPLERGCGMLRLAHTWISPSTPYFKDTLNVEIGTALGDGEIRYTLDGSEPAPSSALYTAPFDVQGTTVVKAAVFVDGRPSGRALERQYVRLPAGQEQLAPPAEPGR